MMKSLRNYGFFKDLIDKYFTRVYKHENAKESDMSQEQKDIYIDAPLHGKVIVTGPPGTGKTVIAFLRALTIAKSKKRVSVTMAQNVLKQYSANAADDEFRVFNDSSMVERLVENPGDCKRWPRAKMK